MITSIFVPVIHDLWLEEDFNTLQVLITKDTFQELVDKAHSIMPGVYNIDFMVGMVPLSVEPMLEEIAVDIPKIADEWRALRSSFIETPFIRMFPGIDLVSFHTYVDGSSIPVDSESYFFSHIMELLK